VTRFYGGRPTGPCLSGPSRKAQSSRGGSLCLPVSRTARADEDPAQVLAMPPWGGGSGGRSTRAGQGPARKRGKKAGKLGHAVPSGTSNGDGVYWRLWKRGPEARGERGREEGRERAREKKERKGESGTAEERGATRGKFLHKIKERGKNEVKLNVKGSRLQHTTD